MCAAAEQKLRGGALSVPNKKTAAILEIRQKKTKSPKICKNSRPSVWYVCVGKGGTEDDFGER